jgi:hypothetical protein
MPSAPRHFFTVATLTPQWCATAISDSNFTASTKSPHRINERVPHFIGHGIGPSKYPPTFTLPRISQVSNAPRRVRGGV